MRFWGRLLTFFVQYHLPSCMRLLEASHVVEILREAGPTGLHVDAMSEKNGVDSKKLGLFRSRVCCVQYTNCV